MFVPGIFQVLIHGYWKRTNDEPGYLYSKHYDQDAILFYELEIPDCISLYYEKINKQNDVKKVHSVKVIVVRYNANFNILKKKFYG